MFGADPAVVLFGGEVAAADRRFAQRDAFAVGGLGDRRRLVVADMRIERGHQHERPAHQLRDPAGVRFDAGHAVLGKAGHAVGQQPDRLQQAVDQQRLEDVELQGAGRAGHGDGGVVAEHARADHGERLALRGVDLARHDRAARLVLRQPQLAQTGARPGTEPADVVGDLHQRGGQRLERAGRLHDRIVSGQRLELVGSGDERIAGEPRDPRRGPLGKLRRRVEPGADRGAAQSQLIQAGQRALDSLPSARDLFRVAGELLAQGERHGVHQVRAADLDDRRERVALGRQRLLQPRRSRQQAPAQRRRGGHVHGGGKGVVGRLRPVDVVVGVDGRLAAECAAGQLDGAVGDHLVGVHVRLRAAAGLPHDQREVVVEFAGDDLVGGAHDQVARLFPQHAELGVGDRRRLLDDAEGAHHLDRHAFAADAEVVARPFRLRPPVAVGGHAHRAERIGLLAETLIPRSRARRNRHGRHQASCGNSPRTTSTSSRTWPADFANAARSPASSCTSMIRSTPPAPSTHGTPTKMPSTPYSP